MPYMEIFKTKDGKFHDMKCDLLDGYTYSGVHQTIGSLKVKPEPPKEQMCEKCFDFLFKEKDSNK